MCELLGLLRKPWSPGPDSLKRPVSASRVSLEDRRLGSSPIIIRMSANRKLAAEATDNGLLAPGLAAGISRGEKRENAGYPCRQLAVAPKWPCSAALT